MDAFSSIMCQLGTWTDNNNYQIVCQIKYQGYMYTPHLTITNFYFNTQDTISTLQVASSKIEYALYGHCISNAVVVAFLTQWFDCIFSNPATIASPMSWPPLLKWHISHVSNSMAVSSLLWSNGCLRVPKGPKVYRRIVIEKYGIF